MDIVARFYLRLLHFLCPPHGHPSSGHCIAVHIDVIDGTRNYLIECPATCGLITVTDSADEAYDAIKHHAFAR